LRVSRHRKEVPETILQTRMRDAAAGAN
jgi:hypothetical protein